MKQNILKKKLIGLIVVCIILIPFHSVFAYTISQDLTPSQRDEILFSIVQIVTINKEGEMFIGSGTTIGTDGLIVTNNHVVIDLTTNEPFDSISICYTLSEYEEPKCAATAKIIAANKDYDLALIIPDKRIGKDGKPTKESFQSYWKKNGKKFSNPPFRKVKDNVLPSILNRITMWGYPVVGGGTITVTSGFVSGFSTEEKGEKTFVKFIKTDGPINPGNSGGAAFGEDFSFIGVPSNAFPGQLGFIIPAQTIAEWITELNVKKIVNIKKIKSLKGYYSKTGK